MADLRMVASAAASGRQGNWTYSWQKVQPLLADSIPARH